MNPVNNETNNTLKPSSNDCMKSPTRKERYKELENRQCQIENLEKIKIKIDEIKQNIIREFAHLTNIDM